MDASWQVVADASPTTWQVAFWSLVCLGATNVSQPRKRFCSQTGGYRIYLVTSPILCAADTISTMMWFVVALYILRGNACAAAQFAASHTIKVHGSGSATELAPSVDEHEPDEEAAAEMSTWPRIILFIIGTLPAAIKLGTQGGIPWTQAWGMMFIVNFVTTELISLLSRSNDQVGKATQQVKDKRMELARRRSRLDAIDTFLVACAYLTHVGLFMFAVSTLWMDAIDKLWDSPLASSISLLLSYFKGVVNTGFLFYLGISALVYLMGRRSRDKLSHAWRTFFLGTIMTFTLVPQVLINECEECLEKNSSSLPKLLLWVNNINDVWNTPQAQYFQSILIWATTALLTGSLCCAVLSIVLTLIGRLSVNDLWRFLEISFDSIALTTALFPTPRPYVPSAPHSYLRKLQYLLIWLYITFAMLILHGILLRLSRRWPRAAQILLIEPKKQNAKAGSEADPALPVDEVSMKIGGALALYFFLSNLTACVTWYAFKYDPAGTNNPSWTDIFG